jgi:hypothetical protein
MSTEATLSPSDVLQDIVELDRPTMSPEVAQHFLALHLSDGAKDRVRGLLQKNNAGTITPSEKATLESYVHVGELLDLLQAKARATLQKAGLAEQ